MQALPISKHQTKRTGELLFRLANADLVKVMTVHSAQLVKADGPLRESKPRGQFRLQSQNSLIGEPLSGFTEAPRRFQDQGLFYTDGVNTLRDEFIQNDDQTPFFDPKPLEEQFVDDAERLDDLRAQLAKPSGSTVAGFCKPHRRTPPPCVPCLKSLKAVSTSTFLRIFFDDRTQKCRIRNIRISGPDRFQWSTEARCRHL